MIKISSTAQDIASTLIPLNSTTTSRTKDIKEKSLITVNGDSTGSCDPSEIIITIEDSYRITDVISHNTLENPQHPLSKSLKHTSRVSADASSLANTFLVFFKDKIERIRHTKLSPCDSPDSFLFPHALFQDWSTLSHSPSLKYINSFLNTIFVSCHMYPENPEGTQVIVGSMNMGYISDTARNRTHNPAVPSQAGADTTRPHFFIWKQTMSSVNSRYLLGTPPPPNS